MAEAALRAAKKAGIATEIFIIVGFPSETPEEFKKTYDFIKKNRHVIDAIKSINTLHLIAGTEITEKAAMQFGMKPLPSENWHYLWETSDGNTYDQRKARAQRLLHLADRLHIKVWETNIDEGKENAFLGLLDQKGERRGQLESLKVSCAKLSVSSGTPNRRRRPLIQWIFLAGLFTYTFLYIFYFWVYMKLHRKVLLGGRREGVGH